MTSEHPRKPIILLALLSLCATFLPACVLVPEWTYTKNQGWSGPEWVPQEKSETERFFDDNGLHRR